MQYGPLSSSRPNGCYASCSICIFFRTNRIEWLLNKGVSYGTLEKKGILISVVDINIQYKKPLHFEEKYFTQVSLDQLGPYFVDFSYIIENVQKDCVATALTRLVFVDGQTRKAIKCPDFLIRIFH